MIEEALVNLIRAASGLTKVQPSTETVVVTADLPRIVYTRIGSQRLYTDSGSSRMVKARYQLDVFADTMTAARTVADAVRGGTDGYSGTKESTRIDRVYFDSDHLERAERIDGNNRTVARVIVDLIVDYRD